MDVRFLISLIVAALFVGAGVWASVYYATYAVRSQLLGRTLWRGRADHRTVALTFDDGPSPDTPAVLDLLKRYNVKAAFFVVGQAVERYPQIARRIVAEGHEIGNHSYSHPIYLFRTRRETERQLESAQRVIEEATGVRPQLARPPCGVRTRAYFKAARRLNLRTVQWDVAGFDWKRIDATRIARSVIRDVRSGSIILLHDGDSAGVRDRSQTIAALPLIIEEVRARGLRFAPLAGMFGEEGLEISRGENSNEPYSTAADPVS